MAAEKCIRFTAEDEVVVLACIGPDGLEIQASNENDSVVVWMSNENAFELADLINSVRPERVKYENTVDKKCGTD